MRAAIWAGPPLPPPRPSARARIALEPDIRLSLSDARRIVPVLAYQQYDGNPRVAGVLFAVIGGGQVVGSLLTFRLVTSVRADAARLACRDCNRCATLAARPAPAARCRRARARDLRRFDSADQRPVHRHADDPGSKGAAREGAAVAAHDQPDQRAARVRRRRDALRQGGPARHVRRRRCARDRLPA